jgi:sulfatase maturation enzyme AslB (radical SAM superfamily)
VAERQQYLVVGGVLDNICNSACQSCNAQHSTKIGSLQDKEYIQINNDSAFYNLPLDRIIQLDINGGEPTASPAYQRLLENLPPNLKYLRVNTNGSRILPNLQNIIQRGIKVTVTVSLDGIGRVHDYVRWPIKWETVEQNLQKYKQYDIELNTWTTVHALNIGDLENIIAYTTKNNIKHSWALLEYPEVLNVKYSNHFTRATNIPEQLKTQVAIDSDNTVDLQLWTTKQDQIRGIKLWDYYKENSQ